MHAVAREAPRILRRAIQQDLRAETVSERNELPRQRVATRQRPVLLAQLDQAESTFERALRPSQECLLSDVARAGNAVDRRQRERGENAGVGGQQRRNRIPTRSLPLKGLPVVSDQFAFPRKHAKEMQFDMRVRVDEFLDEPRRGTPDDDAQLFAQFAAQRLARRLAGFELASRKLPIAGVGFALRALRKQDRAVGTQQDGRGDANDLAVQRPAGGGCSPA